MILTYTCAICGWPRLEEEQWSSSGGGSNEICPCCGFEPGYTDDDQGFSVEEWRQRWTTSGMSFRSTDDRLPPAGWDPDAQLEALLTSEPPPLPDLPSNAALRSALEEGDARAAARALITGGAVLALAGPDEDDASVAFIETSNGDLRLLVFSGPRAWQSWAAAPSAPRQARAVRGSDLVTIAQARGADWIVVDLGGPAAMAVEVARLADRVVDPLRSRVDDGSALAPDLPDNPALRSALAAGDVPAAARALTGGTVVLAMLGPAADDALVLVEAPDGAVKLLVFTGPEPWEAWARGSGRPRFAGAIRGSGLVASVENQRVGQVVIDLAGPFPVEMTLDQLRSLVAT